MQVLTDIEFTSHGTKGNKLLDSDYIKLNSFKGSQEKNRNTQESPTKQKEKMAGGRKDDQLEEPKLVLWSREKVKLGWPNRSFYHGAGMENLGNTCYMNSSLQVSIYCDLF